MGNFLRTIFYQRLTPSKQVAAFVSAENPGIVFGVMSTAITGLFYDHSGMVRFRRVKNCFAHFIDRIFRPIYEKIAGLAGLSHKGSTTQGLYDCYYYLTKKLGRLWKYLLVEVYSSTTDPCPPPAILGEASTKPSHTRWATVPMETKSLIAKLEVPATEALIAAKDFFETSTIASMCTIYDESKTSALMFILPDLLHDRCPGPVVKRRVISAKTVQKY